MSLFLILMFAGLFGMALMAIPAFGRHSHGMGVHGHLPGATHAALPHAPAGTLVPRAGTHAAAPTTGAQANAASSGNGAGVSRWIPSPRIVFSILAAYGAFGYALVEAFHTPLVVAYILALLPAVLLERLALTPLWNALLGFQGTPSTPVENLVMAEAHAVTPFRNGKGIVRVVRDGREVQFSAQLAPAQAAMPVRVGDKLRVEEVNPDGEHLQVSVG